MLGLHLEGNYLNPAMKGGQPPEYISNPDPAEYEAMLDAAPCIKRWSAASELPGAHDFARVPFRGACWVALAHTTADYGEVKAACAAGFTHATHFYNAMTGVHREGEYKREGTVEGIYLTDEMTVEVIADGIHVPPALLRMAYKFKGAERVALVTDSMAAGAMPEGGKPFDPRVIVEDGVCKLADRSALAGSIATPTGCSGRWFGKRVFRWRMPCAWPPKPRPVSWVFRTGKERSKRGRMRMSSFSMTT